MQEKLEKTVADDFDKFHNFFSIKFWRVFGIWPHCVCAAATAPPSMALTWSWLNIEAQNLIGAQPKGHKG